jgi:CRP-like cAMP-binding protein
MSAPERPPAIAELLSGLIPLNFKAGSSLVAPGTMDASLWWIESGLVRLYSLGESGLVRNHDFIEPGNWAFGSLNWNDGELCCGGTALGLEALEPTVALRLPLATLQHARLSSPSVAQWVADEMMRHSSRQMQREAALLQTSAEDRYLAFLSERPAVAGRIAQHHIAAWLGITPVGLSRIRARLKDARTTDSA